MSRWPKAGDGGVDGGADGGFGADVARDGESAAAKGHDRGSGLLGFG